MMTFMKKENGYAFLSNSRTAILEKDGEIEWFPCPRFDSESVFSKILDNKTGGSFSIRPSAKYVVSTEYIGNSLAVKNIFTTEKGRLSVIDFMPVGLPSLIRIVDSKIPFSAIIEPRFGYGKTKPLAEKVDGGISFRNPYSEESVDIKVEGPFDLHEDELRFRPGKASFLVLYSKNAEYGLFGGSGQIYPKPIEALARMKEYWKGQMTQARNPSIFQRYYKRSLSVMIGLTYAPSGAMVAAATTSLPTVVGGRSNWDYRYAWIRDMSYATEAFAKAGMHGRAQRALNFMMSTIDISSKNFDHPLFQIDGTAPMAEKELGWLSGHLGSRPVRIGNGAYSQMQHDTEGEFMNALYAYFSVSRDIGFIRENMWAVDAIAAWCENTWDEKSTSLWEERTSKGHFVHTKLMCWVAIDRARKLKIALGNGKEANRLGIVARRIREDIIANGFSEELGYFVKHYDSTRVDASLLTMPLYGFINANDERFLGTLNQILKKLGSRVGLLHRTEEDYEGKESGPFTLINTWLARVYLRMNRKTDAVNALKSLAQRSTRLGLFSERVDPDYGTPLGNFPQLFPHAGFVTAISEYDNPRLTKI